MDIHKVFRDGKVAVLYSPNFGCGWYTAHKNEQLLFDYKVVEMVEAKADYKDIVSYCIETYGKGINVGGAFDLQIAWLPIGSEFTIQNYDGFESIVMKDKVEFIST
jgi:hypothetical protein